MTYGNAASIPAGGACAYQLSTGPRSAGLARSLLKEAMSTLGMPRELIEDGVLAASELATNAHRHAERNGSVEPVTPPELWIWSRSHPTPQLVVSVFDADRDRMPQPGTTSMLEEASVSAACGAHLSRSRLGAWPVPGKAVWFALPLPGSLNEATKGMPPSLAAHRLVQMLATRGIDGHQRSDHQSMSVVTVAGLVVLIDPKSFSWDDARYGHVRFPLTDLHETAERVVERLESDGLK